MLFDDPKAADQHPWHALHKDEALRLLDSSDTGLEEREAQRRLKLYGPNVLQVKSTETIPRVLLRQFHNPLIYVLLCSTLLAFLLGKFTDGSVVFAVVILNASIGFWQEYRAYKTIKSLTAMVPLESIVLRDGSAQVLPSHTIVPGDVVFLQAGDRISADLRLIALKNLQCEEATLTGESAPVNKRIDAVPEEALVAERKCIAYNGTYVTSGIGLGVVVATGLNTEFGRISDLIEQVAPLQTPMSLAIKTIAKWVTLGVLLVSLSLFFVGYLRGSHLFDAALAAITLAVAAIPEGLPAIITIASSIGVRRMARKSAIIRQLPAVEALGSASVICTDKTGTLTHNEMTVQRIWSPSGFSFLSGTGYSGEGELICPDPVIKEEVIELLKGAILCSDASLDQNHLHRKAVGDPTEIAIVVAGRKMQINEDLLRKACRRVDVIPFESERRMMATLNVTSKQQKHLFVKGAPEEIYRLCASTVDSKPVGSMAREGMRILAVAKKKVLPSLTQIEEGALKEGYTFLGLLGMTDPPRKEVYPALTRCRDAGITVKMVTGDHPLTAEAIGRDLGLLKGQPVVTGADLNRLTTDAWRDLADKAHVFARVSPEHKLLLVQALQESGHVVAMTGDGVNDAAALKRADIGVAMGIKGTAVAKEASDMILADDNFASIVAAAEEGRRVYDNLIKSLLFVLPTSLGQALVILVAVLFFPVQEGILLHPITPVQILWVNLIVAAALSLPLAFEAAEPHIMKRPPRSKAAPIFSLFLTLRTFVVSVIMAAGTIGLFLWEYHADIAKGMEKPLALSDAQTLAVTAIIFFQIFYLFDCRSLTYSVLKNRFFSNRWIFVGIGIVLCAQVAFVYLPWMQQLFKSSSLNLQSWVTSAFVTFLIVPLLAMERLIPRRLLGLREY